MNDLIQVDSGQMWTTSLLVAEKFGKRHADVIRAIRNIECSPQFAQRNFALSEYVDGTGRKLPMFRISRDGFTMLAMGFTGAAAAQWRETFIRAFNEMEKALRFGALNADAERARIRTIGKLVRLDLTDTVKRFVEYAIVQGSKSAGMYYMSITKMEYQALFLVGKAVGKNFRDCLTARQGSYVMTAETIAQKALCEGMTAGMHYKEIYQLAKQRVEAYSALLGKTVPGDDRLMLASA